MDIKTQQDPLTLRSVIRETARTKGNNIAFSSISSDQELTYSEVVEKTDSLIHFLEKNNIQPGDKVAILSINLPYWPVVYFAITSMGAIAVPLLPDFSENEIGNILRHSETRVVFASQNLAKKLENLDLPELKYVFSMKDFSRISGEVHKEYAEHEKPNGHYLPAEDDLAAIIYTSGTTGESKGVMLSHKNIVFNAKKSGKIHYISENDRFLSILPLSHTYENTTGMVLPVMVGAHIYYLSKPPTQTFLLPALQKVQPTVMLTVPLIIEKIYRSKIRPAFTGNKFTQYLYAAAPTRKIMNLIAGYKLKKTFGGKLKFFGIGGAKLNGVVEKFLQEARFPYAIGYGLTETSPLIAGVNPKTARWQSTGPAIEGIDLKIHAPDPDTGEGEIWVKGPNVMKGYYKNESKTREVLTPDSWFKTGDLGKLDKKGYLYIKGRLKNMILNSAGENIYPEEIESIINNFNHVVESVVVEQKGKLVAMVHFNQKELEEKYMDFKEEISALIERKTQELRDELIQYVNNRVSRFSKLQVVEVHSEPFQKTATYKIKRFLYTE